MKAYNLYFRLGVPKFSKIRFTIAVELKSNIELAKRKIAKKDREEFQETGNTFVDQGTEESGVSAPLNSSKIRGKSCDETIAEAAEP